MGIGANGLANVGAKIINGNFLLAAVAVSDNQCFRLIAGGWMVIDAANLRPVKGNGLVVIGINGQDFVIGASENATAISMKIVAVALPCSAA